MPALPRLRKLQQDAPLYTMALYSLRLLLETQIATGAKPTEPAALHVVERIVQLSEQWVAAGEAHLVRQYRCTKTQAEHLMKTLIRSVEATVSMPEMLASVDVEAALKGPAPIK